MLTVSQTKKSLDDSRLSDGDVEKIRDTFDMLAEIIFERWLEQKNKNEYETDLQDK